MCETPAPAGAIEDVLEKEGSQPEQEQEIKKELTEDEPESPALVTLKEREQTQEYFKTSQVI